MVTTNDGAASSPTTKGKLSIGDYFGELFRYGVYLLGYCSASKFLINLLQINIKPTHSCQSEMGGVSIIELVFMQYLPPTPYPE